MLINIHLLTRYLSTLQPLQYEHLGSSTEAEELHGAAPDQEEKMVSYGFVSIIMLVDLEYQTPPVATTPLIF